MKKHNDESRKIAAPASPGEPRDVDPRPMKVSSDGRISIPPDMQEAMAVGEDGRVTARVEAGELRIVSPAAAVWRVQARMQKFKKPGERIVDRFLAERSALWGEK